MHSIAHGILFWGLILVAAVCTAEQAIYPANPTTDGRLVYVAGTGVAAYSAESNQPFWRSLQAHRLRAPLAVGNAVYLSGGRQLFMLDGASGRMMWSHRFERPVFSPIYTLGRLVVTDEAGGVHALDAGSGELLWSQQLGDGWVYPPASQQGVLITGGQDGVAWALDANDGTIRWRRPLGQELVYSPVAVDVGRVALATFSGKVLLLDAATGRDIWNRTLTAPALHVSQIGPRLLLAGMGGELLALDSATGDEHWRRRLPARAVAPLVQVAGEPWVVLDDGRVLQLDIESGATLAQQQMAGDLLGSVSLSGHKVVVFNRPGNVAALQPVYLEATNK